MIEIVQKVVNLTQIFFLIRIKLEPTNWKGVFYHDRRTGSRSQTVDKGH